MDVFNSIMIGFEWSQELQLADGVLAADDGLRAEFRYKAEDLLPIFAIADGDGITIDDQLVTIVVDGARTGLIAPPDPLAGWRFVYADLVRVPATGAEKHLGFRLQVPAVLPVTRAPV